MKKIFFLFLILLFIGSCGTKTESDKVIDIIYPSENIQVPPEFYILAVSISWKDTFIFNPLLFGRVKTINPEGLKGKIYIDNKFVLETKKAKHHFIKVHISDEGKHIISFKTKYGSKSVYIKVKPTKIIFVKEKIDLQKKLENLKKLVIKQFKWKDKKKFIRYDNFKLVNIVPNDTNLLLVWKKFYKYSSLFKFSIINIQEKTKKDFNLPDNLLYGNNGELYFSDTGIDSVVSCGNGFLFRILKENTVLLYRLNNDGSILKTEVSLYKYADKNDKLMTPAYKYPNYYHIACAKDYQALLYPVYGDYNLDYKAVIYNKDKFTKSARFIDFDNFKASIFLTDKGSLFVYKIPDRVLNNEKSRLFYLRDKNIKEVLIPLPFEKDYYPINKAYVNIKGVYFPPKIKINTLFLDKLYMSVEIFEKRGTFSIKEL